MNKGKVYLLALILVIVLSILFSYRVRYSKRLIPVNEHYVFNQMPAKQTVSVRKWRKIKFHMLSHISCEGIGLREPEVIKVDQSGNLYVLNFSVPDIVKMRISGEILRTFGNGRGAAPGQLINPTDFAINRRGDVWVTDPVNDMVTVFSRYAKAIGAIRPKVESYSIAALANGRCALRQSHGKEISIYNLEGRESSFGGVFNEQFKYALVLWGLLCSDGQDNLYCALTHTGVLISYGVSGHKRFFVRTIDGTSLPQLVEDQGTIRLAPNATFTAMSVMACRNRVLVLDAAGSRELDGTPLDIYNGNTGSYVASILLPGKFSSVAVQGDTVFALNDTSITVYSGTGLLITN